MQLNNNKTISLQKWQLSSFNRLRRWLMKYDLLFGYNLYIRIMTDLGFLNKSEICWKLILCK